MTDEDDPAALVAQFADASLRVVTLFQLNALGDAALPAVREGLKHPDWHVRHWCAIFLSRVGVVQEQHPVDIVPLLIEQAEHDPVVDVRTMAVIMLTGLPRDARIPPVLEGALSREQDRRLRLHAQRGLKKYAAA
jgi:HEAT repeat protein